MIHAYDKLYLEKARTILGRMLDFTVYDLKYNLVEFYSLFLNSNYSKQFETGSTSLLAGKSGVEIAYDLTGEFDIKPKFTSNRSPEYWAGWALAYYQWFTSLSFAKINEFVSIDEVVEMYPKYHEMDIRQFVDRLNEIYKKKVCVTNLKQKRMEADLSQGELSKISGVPVRTIQQYEQRAKNINSAKVETVLQLAQSLSCSVNDLLEII